VIDNHGGSSFGTSYGVEGNALYSVVFTSREDGPRRGIAWSARSALDAVDIMNVAVNYLREHCSTPSASIT